MAATTLADVSAALSLVYPPDITNQINRKTVLPHLIPVKPGSGKGVYGTAKFTGATNAAASAEGVQRSATDADQEVKVPYSQSWSQYEKTASVTDLSAAGVATNLNNGSAGAINGDLMAGECGDMAQRVMMGVAGDLFAGDPGATPVEIAGLALAIDSSGTFQTIAPGTYTEWASVENTFPLADITQTKIEDELLTPIYDACNEKPDLMVTTSAIFSKIKALFTGRDITLREITTARGTVKLMSGIDAIEVAGVPLVKDPYCTTGVLYAVNTNYVSIEQLLPAPLQAIFGVDRPREALVEFLRMVHDDPRLVIPDKDLDGMMARATTLMPCIKLLGARGLSTEAMVYLFAQTHWSKRNAHGKLVLT